MDAALAAAARRRKLRDRRWSTHPDVLAGSDIMGDDGIDLRRLHDQSDEADERHPIDVEICDEALWVQPVDMTLQGFRERLRTTTLNP